MVAFSTAGYAFGSKSDTMFAGDRGSIQERQEIGPDYINAGSVMTWV